MKYQIKGMSEKPVITSVKKTADGKLGFKTIRQLKSKNKKEEYFLEGEGEVEYTKENVQSILQIMEEQAKEYIKQKEDAELIYEGSKKSLKKSALVTGILILLITILFDVFNVNAVLLASDSNILVAVMRVAMAAIYASPIVYLMDDIHHVYSSKAELDDVKKYELYMNDVKSHLSDYKKMIECEKRIGMSDDRETQLTRLSIFNLDRFSLEDLREMKRKIALYREITRQNSSQPLQTEPEIGKVKIKTTSEKK